jgi:hypothetical protein
MHPANARRFTVALGLALPIVLSSPYFATLQATVPSTSGFAPAIEWDLPDQVNTLPGAILVEASGNTDRVWFVTRAITPLVYRVDLRDGKKVKPANWLSWDLDPAGLLASGLRRIKTSWDSRSVFVKTTISLQQIDTGACTTSSSVTTCPRTVWFDANIDPADPNAAVEDEHKGSDIAVDGNKNVYSAVGVQGDVSSLSPAAPGRSFVQRLNPNLDQYNVTRWYVGGSAGNCALGGASNPCLSGVAISRRSPDLVYYSEPEGGPDGSGAIAELNPATNTVRRWTFSQLNAAIDPYDANPRPAREPRQLQFDSDGVLWTVAGSGHLVSVDPKRSRMSKHAMPNRIAPPVDTDPFGVAPDGGFIGYTDSSELQNKVAMLIPARNSVPVYPDSVKVLRKDFSNAGVNNPPAIQNRGMALPTPHKFVTQRTPTPDGTFIEAVTTSDSDSLSPTGIFPDPGGRVGTFFYAVGTSQSNRFGRIKLPRDHDRARIERDDDDFDDDGTRNDVDDDVDGDGVKNTMDADSDNDGTPDSMDDDDDDDGIVDSDDTPDHKETKQTSAQDVAPADFALDQFTVNPNTLLAAISATSSNPLAPVTIQILNSAGQVVASSLATPGTAVLAWTPPASGGDFTLRVKNQGTGTATLSTKILTRELWLP